MVHISHYDITDSILTTMGYTRINTQMLSIHDM